MDRLEAIGLFARLVERGSFSAVAREWGIGQPAVSKQIAALEKYLGVQLVLRTSRSVVITDAGQAFYESSKALMEDFDALESSVGVRQQSPRGRIRLTTAPGHGRLSITPLLPAFFQRYPDVSIELSVSDRHVDLVSQGIDLAIRHGSLADSSLTAQKLSETDLVLVASPGYIAEHGRLKRLADLDRHECIVFTHGREPRPWLFKAGEETVHLTPRGRIYTGDAEHIRAAAVGGMGIAQAPRWLVDDQIRAGNLKAMLPGLQPPPLPIHLVYPAGRRVPARVKVFIEYLMSAFRR
jgi:DNA-binding transcriptional LysR family regulator